MLSFLAALVHVQILVGAKMDTIDVSVTVWTKTNDRVQNNSDIYFTVEDPAQSSQPVRVEPDKVVKPTVKPVAIAPGSYPTPKKETAWERSVEKQRLLKAQASRRVKKTPAKVPQWRPRTEEHNYFAHSLYSFKAYEGEVVSFKFLEFQFSEWGHLGWWVPGLRIALMDMFSDEVGVFPIGLGYFIPTEYFVLMPFIERNGFNPADPFNIDHLVVEAGVDVALRQGGDKVIWPINLRAGLNYANGGIYPMLGASVFLLLRLGAKTATKTLENRPGHRLWSVGYWGYLFWG
jgi:hypothetical protein